MTDQQLREELHRIAERAPEAYVPTDTFDRGRRAHRRSVVIAISAISAAIVLIAGSVVFTQQRDSADVHPARGDTDLAVPDTIYATPTWLAETEDGHYANVGKLEHDLAIGTGAIAYVQPAQDSNGAVAVVIDADDGDYHPLALPDFIGLDPYWRNSSGDDSGHRPLALSPDGTQLAWSWGLGRDAATDSQHVSGGVRIADLTTGEVFEWDLSDDGATYVTGVEWSDGGRQLLWTGLQMDQWGSGSYVPADAAAGVITYASDSMTTYSGGIGTGTDLSLWAISDDGTIAFNGLPGSDVQVQQASGGITPLPLPDMASTYEPIMFHGSDLYVTTEDGLARVDGSGPAYPSPNKMPLVPVGWVGDGPLFKLHGQDDVYFGQVWAVDDTTGGEYSGGNSLIAVDGDANMVVDTVSIAYDLIDADSIEHPTVHRGKPFFVPLWVGTAIFWLIGAVVVVVLWRQARRVLLVVAGLAALLVLVGAVLLFDITGLTSGSDSPRGPGGNLEIESSGSPGTGTPGRTVIPQSVRWTDTPASDIPVSESLAVGRAILAFSDETGALEDDGIAVVITAEGDYQRLRLPGTEGASDILMGRPILLAPDGAQLAYVTEEPSVNVLDLETGEVTPHPLTLGGDEITSIAWSPDSTWLVWHSDYDGQRAGRITPDCKAEPLPDGDWAHAGIGNDGTVVARTESGTRTWPEATADLSDTSQGTVSTWVDTGTTASGPDDVRSIDSDMTTRVDFAIGLTGRGVDVDGRRLVEVAGWLNDGTPLIVTEGEDANDLRTVTDDGSTEVVAEIDSRLHMVSIATALPDDLAVKTPKTEWAGPSPLRWLPPVGAIGTVVAGFLVWRARRGRRTAL